MKKKQSMRSPLGSLKALFHSWAVCIFCACDSSVAWRLEGELVGKDVMTSPWRWHQGIKIEMFAINFGKTAQWERNPQNKSGIQVGFKLKTWKLVSDYQLKFGRVRPLGNFVYVACLLLLCQGSKWLNGKSIWLVFRRSWVWIPAGSRIFFHAFISHFSTRTSLSTSGYCHIQ